MREQEKSLPGAETAAQWAQSRWDRRESWCHRQRMMTEIRRERPLVSAEFLVDERQRLPAGDDSFCGAPKTWLIFKNLSAFVSVVLDRGASRALLPQTGFRAGSKPVPRRQPR